MSQRIQLNIGYSPCPNDTYIFYAMVHGKIPLEHIAYAPPLLEDVETLNDWALEGRLDVTKLSFHALGHVADRYTLLRAGAALGRGCGPLLVTGAQRKKRDIADWKIAIPGRYTTAAMLLKLFEPACHQLVVMRFDDIMDGIKNGDVDAGVIIHESRFTYSQLGLDCVQDLGAWWEQETGLPIPLGCIAARNSLNSDIIEEIDSSIAASIRWTRENPASSREYIIQHAQELEQDVIQNHIGLYVNDFSLDIGVDGLAAVEELFRRGCIHGIFPQDTRLPWRSGVQ